MPEFDDNERGAIWPNKKRESDRHPHFTGQAKIDGKEYWVSAWKRADDANPNAPSLSFSFKLKENQPGQSWGDPKDTGMVDIESDLPF